MSACFSHSAAHSAHAMRYASNTAFTVARLLPVRRLRMWPVAVQISAQSRLRRMQLRSSVTISSPRQASAHAVQVWAHSKHAAIQSASLATSRSLVVLGWASIIEVIWLMCYVILQHSVLIFVPRELFGY